MDWLAFPSSVRTLRSKLEFRDLGLDRASTTAIPISYTGIIPAGGIITSNPTEDRHTIGITNIKCILVTTVIISVKPRWAQSARINEFVLACLWYDTVIRVYDAAGNVIETYEHKGDFREP